MSRVDRFHGGAAPRSLLAGLLGLGLLTLAACGDDAAAGNNNGVITCENETDCPAGMTCRGNVCAPISSPDAGADVFVPMGTISVYPDPVQFGNASLNVETLREVTVANTGTGDLTVTRITVLEDDALDEYAAQPSGDLTLVIAPGASETIQVSLRPEDAELDIAELEIVSNDPEHPVVTVALVSEYKGDPTLEQCVLPLPPPDPEPFVDCTVDAGTGDAVLDFGVVTFGTAVSRLVAIRNGADGNAPLVVQGAAVTSSSSAIANDFDVRLFAYDTDGVTEIDLTPPIYLSAGDPAQALPPDLIYAEVTFGGNVDGVVTNTRLEVDTNDPGGPPVPISAAVSGCPRDYWDLNNDPDDGCEYHCVYQGPEQCGNGVDDNCNGVQDEQGGMGCSLYYRDDDRDGYGVTTNVRCLCAPDPTGHYDATLPGDCNDGNDQIRPGATEVCDGVDNDCNPATTEDFGTTTCGLGVCQHTVQNCLNGVPQTCDPLEGQSAEICDGQDNNCNGDVDEMLDTDVNNCGTCGNTCTNDHGTTNCVSGTCTPSCSGLWRSCDNDPDNGCETEAVTLTHCGACNAACALPNASESCATGTCQITGCDVGYCNFDNVASNGCEENLEPTIACPSQAIDIGSVNGDSGSTSTSYSSHGEKWLRVYVAEADSDPTGCTNLSVRLRLTVPAGTDYDLYAYCDNCTTSEQYSNLGPGQTDEVIMAWEEDCFLGFPTGTESGRYIYMRVEHWSANVCSNWTLTATGHVSYTSTTCSTK